VVPLASLLGLSDTPGELADRSGFISGEELKQLIAEALDPDSRARCCSPGCSPTMVADS
jgi:hypothetical protein